MSALQFQFRNESDQEKKILQEIQDINKKLSANSYSVKNLPPKNSHLKQSRHHQQNYFSQQCDDLFADHHYPPKAHFKDPLDISLFNSNNSLLLQNQFEKQIKNFPEFSTNQNPSENLISIPKCSKLNFSNEPKNTNSLESKSKQSKNSSICLLKNTKSLASNNSLCKIVSSTRLQKLNSETQCQKDLKCKEKLVAKNINQLIENKQNIQAAFNTYKQQSFIKEIKNRIRFPTQPDQQNLIMNKVHTFFQNENQLVINKNGRDIMPEHETKNKLKNHHDSLQCTFKPSILKKSHEIAENLQPSFQRLTQEITISRSQPKIPYKAKQDLTQKKYSIKRLEQLSQPRMLKIQTQKEEPSYHFRPTLSKKSLQQMANCTIDVATRNRLWLQQKQAKLCKLKSEQEEKKLKKELGSFAPKITPYKGENQVHFSRFAKQGISSYFERVSMAKHKIQTAEKKKPSIHQTIKETNPSMKKKTYDQAVKELHKKILTMEI